MALAALMPLVSPQDARGATADRRLGDVLLELRASGLDIIFSEELVRPEMLVRAPARAGSPRAVLDEVLAPHGLQARSGPGGRLLIVKAADPDRASKPRVPPATGLRLLVRLAGTAPPIGFALSIPELGLTLPILADGSVALPMAPGLYRLEARLGGHRSWSADGISVTPGQATEVTVALEPDASAREAPAASEVILTVHPRDRFRDAVDVRSRTASPADDGTRELPVADVKATAGALENVFRTLALLPGVTPANEVQSRFSVRGGAPDENLTVADGVEVYNPFRLEATVSAFLAETVDSFELSTGLMSARHGDRLSSVLEVRSRGGDPRQRLGGTAAVSLSDANVVLEGRLPGNRDASWLVAGRRTYYDLVAERFVSADLPGFQDLQLNLRWPWGERSALVLRGLHGRETGGAGDVFGPPDDALSDRFHHRSLDERVSATLDLGLGRRFTSSTTVSSCRNPQDTIQASGPLPYEVRYERRLRIHDLALRQRVLLEASAHQRWEAGFELHRLDTGWSMHGRGDLPTWWVFRGPSLAPNLWGSRGDALDTVSLDGSRRSTRWGAWLQGDVDLAEGLSLQPGLRLERSTINRDLRLLPRVGAVWRLGSSTRLRAGVGWFAQSPGFEKTILSDTFLDFGGTEPLPLRSESARHVLLGVERDLAPGLAARVELYHKRFDDLIVGRLESDEEQRQRLASYMIPPDFPGGPPLEPLITASPVNDGRGSARGFELSLVRPASSSVRLGGMVSYSYGVATRESYGLSYPFDYDRRHAFTLTLDLQLSRSVAVSAAWRGATGLPYTPPRPVVSFGLEQRAGEPPRRTPSRWRMVLVPGPPAEDDPLAYDVGPGSLSEMNSARHPFYSRLDLRARFRPGGPRGRWELYLDVYNALNEDVMSRSNGPAFDPAVTLDPSSGRWRVVDVHSEVPFFVIPSFGLRFRF